MGYSLFVDRPVDFDSVERRVDDSRNAVDRTFEQDAEAADVKQGQAGKPAVVIPEAEVQRRTDRAPQVVAIGQHRPFRLSSSSGRINHAVQTIQAEPSPGPRPRWTIRSRRDCSQFEQLRSGIPCANRPS